MIRFYSWEECRQAWRWISVQAMTASVVVQGAWELSSVKQYLPSWLGFTISASLLILGIAGRFIKQKPVAK